MGAPNIAEFAPGKNCFINVADFDSPASLAAHLERLSADEAEYGKLLAWKAQPLRPQFLAMAESVRIWNMYRLCGVIGDGTATGRGMADGLSAFGRISSRPFIRWLSGPLRVLLHHLFRLLKH